MGMLCTLIYTSDEEDAHLFEDEVLRGLYEEISGEADRQGLKITYAPEGGWICPPIMRIVMMPLVMVLSIL